MEPTPLRDNGPFRSTDQALSQFAAQTFGMPLPNKELCGSVIREATVLTGVSMSDFEMDYLNEHLAGHYDPIFAQIMAGWIIRAHMSGVDKGQNKF